ncbi:hypothetical protein J3Q64DRAFT_1701051 [Phycomyces blakesleeanus]|uniref:KxDL domain-containing protein n=2 Tax=Phycomyces blakesleeanus TaxID=4837 RepID=A0A162N642_PHYB8|nr:hypothetical protein PHYBLDRAFT_175440 [Phycomyces blakesleeanus NRRL 1555(-)]OAD66144.1 hypothetical protein PHYBLDRAFT_175440 [Phycomyces blakesleeanus NRRL 1555(-)]|eukprot:XP_018284184.1 hypothetical protein PHYBLDRAFT_175440 [Phycomyces blakesleeanus NRRL 1555(-)]
MSNNINPIADHLLQMTNETDNQRMLKEQEEALAIYKSTQQSLCAFNDFSKARYQDVNKHFESHAKLLKEIKGDLESVFGRLQNMKQHLGNKYPAETLVVLQKYPAPILQDD